MSDENAEGFKLHVIEPNQKREGSIDAHDRIVEALLFASATPLDETMLQNRLPPDQDVSETLARLAKHYEDRGVNLINVGQGWAFRTAPDLAGALRTNVPLQRKVSRAAVETLAIIAYHQPATRAEVEEIRGVAMSRGTLDTLLEAGWVRPRGRRRVPGRPLQWGTTPAFLDHFGLESLAELPGQEELKAAGMLDRRPGLTSIAMGETLEADEDEDEPADGQEDLLPLDNIDDCVDDGNGGEAQNDAEVPGVGLRKAPHRPEHAAVCTPAMAT